MGPKLQSVDLSFAEWLNLVFDHPVSDRAWYWDSDDEWELGRETGAHYLCRLFAEAGSLPQRFCDEQIAIGLKYLIDPGNSDTFFSLLAGPAPWEVRKSGLEAIYILFRDLFQKRCSDALGHIDEPGGGALNGTCYMWWDILPVHGQPESPALSERDALLLDVMRNILHLESDSVRESALHGLGHWQIYYPEQVEKIVTDFIWKHRKIRDSLRNYAYAAMHGDVL